MSVEAKQVILKKLENELSCILYVYIDNDNLKFSYNKFNT